MMIDQILADVLRREGGFVDHPADRGGPTKYGITLRTLADWRGAAVTREDIRALSSDEAAAIYRRRYVEQPGFTAVADDRLRAFLVDYAVHSGPATAVKALQRALHVEPDGVFGAQTKAALAGADAAAVYGAVYRQRQALFLSLALDEIPTHVYLRTHPSVQLQNLRGWMNRLAEFV